MSFIISPSMVTQTEEKVYVSEDLPASLYSLCHSDKLGFYLIDQKENNEDLKGQRFYGDLEEKTSRIVETFERRSKTTGVLLTGEKGSGKTLLARRVSSTCIERGYPVIVVENPFCGVEFNQFMNSESIRKKPFVVVFEEFEKVYKNIDDVNRLLGFLDGAVASKKLCIFTSNIQHPCDQLKNRPSRVYYTFNYDVLSDEVIREVCLDKAKFDEATVKKIVVTSQILGGFNFDMLNALLEELTNYPDMNIMRCVKDLGFVSRAADVKHSVKGYVKDHSVCFYEGKNWYNPSNESFNIKIDSRNAVEGSGMDSYMKDDDSEMIIELTPSDIVHVKGDVYTYEVELDDWKTLLFTVERIHNVSLDMQNRLLTKNVVDFNSDAY